MLATDPLVHDRAAGAEAFWRSMPVREVLDEPTPGELLQTIHVELDVTALPGNPVAPRRD